MQLQKHMCFWKILFTSARWRSFQTICGKTGKQLELKECDISEPFRTIVWIIEQTRLNAIPGFLKSVQCRVISILNCDWHRTWQHLQKQLRSGGHQWMHGTFAKRKTIVELMNKQQLSRQTIVTTSCHCHNSSLQTFSKQFIKKQSGDRMQRKEGSKQSNKQKMVYQNENPFAVLQNKPSKMRIDERRVELTLLDLKWKRGREWWSR